MLLTKQSLSVLHASTKDDAYYSLDHALIDQPNNRIIVANGSSMYVSKLYDADVVNVANFPSQDDISKPITEEMLIPVSALTKASKNIPTKSTMSILQRINVTKSEHYVHLQTTDLNTFDDVKIKTPKDESFPDVQQIINIFANKKKESVSVTLSVKELETMIKVAKSHKAETLDISIIDNTQPVKVQSDDKHLTGYIMPCRV